MSTLESTISKISPMSVRQRNRVLFENTVRAGSPKFDVQTALITSEDSPGREGGQIAQGSLEYAVALAEIGGDVQTIQRIVAATLDAQHHNPRALGHGNWRWTNQHTEVVDPNAVSFVIPNYYYLLTQHKAILSDALVNRIHESFALAKEALLAHRCQWAYGNIFISNILCKLQIGCTLNDPRLIDIGCWEFEEWISNTSRFGIVEFNSPVYTAVHIRAFECMTQLPIACNIVRMAEQCLELYYTDLFMHYHPWCGRFAGTKSRLYDACLHNGTGLVMPLLYRQTGEGPPPPTVDDAGYALNEYTLPPQITSLATTKKKLPRKIEVAARYQDAKRYAWLDEKFAVSSMTGGGFGPSDVQLEFIFGQGKNASSVHLRGKPNRFDFFSAQDRNLVVGAVRWRFMPITERKAGPPDSLLRYKVRDNTSCIAGEINTALLQLTLGDARAQPTIYIDEKLWTGSLATLDAQTSVVLETEDIYLAYRSSSAHRETLRWIEDRVVTEVAVDAPQREPWYATHPLLMWIESKENIASLQAFFALVENTTLTSERINDVERVTGQYDGRNVQAEVPLQSRDLFSSKNYRLPEGRLAQVVGGDPSLKLFGTD